MFANVLIANRGEIACRIIRTARRLGMRTIALHTPADRGALFTRMADEAGEIGAGAEGYLDGEAIIALAERPARNAMHPGYGFLSENADFAERAREPGSPSSGRRPRRCGRWAEERGQGADGQGWRAGRARLSRRQSEPKFLKEKAYEIGYPVLIKAIAGGGGRGMRRVDAQSISRRRWSLRRARPTAAFGDARVLIEKYFVSPRHIEVQVFGDSHGDVVHLFERDCSFQRRHQKVIEESPGAGAARGARAAMARRRSRRRARSAMSAPARSSSSWTRARGLGPTASISSR